MKQRRITEVVNNSGIDDSTTQFKCADDRIDASDTEETDWNGCAGVAI